MNGKKSGPASHFWKVWLVCINDNVHQEPGNVLTSLWEISPWKLIMTLLPFQQILNSLVHNVWTFISIPSIYIYWVLYYLLRNINLSKTFPVLKNSGVFRKDWYTLNFTKATLVFCLSAMSIFNPSVHSIIIILEVRLILKSDLDINFQEICHRIKYVNRIKLREDLLVTVVVFIPGSS